MDQIVQYASTFVQHTYSYYESMYTTRISTVGPQPGLYFYIIAGVSILPYLIMAYILDKYKYTHIQSYAVIKDYFLMTVIIILLSCMDLCVKENTYSLVPDFMLIISPAHSLLVINMMNPNFNRNYTKFHINSIWKMAPCTMILSYITIINNLPSHLFIYSRQFFLFLNAAVIFCIMNIVVTDVFNYIKSKRRGGPSFWEIFNAGGFPRYQVAFIHIIHWGTYWILTLLTGAYFVYPLIFAFLGGFTSLISLLSNNRYFLKSFRHMRSFQRIRGRDMLPENCHSRYRLESLHIFSFHRR